jgi:hypothetical protein
MDEQREIVKVKRTQKDYSLAFKFPVIDLVEKGRIDFSK